MDLNGSTLLISRRSPFARRVRLAFLEAGIEFTERILEVFHPNAELNAINPLGRVPTLILRSGQICVDSHVILARLYEAQGHPYQKYSEAQRHKLDFWTAMGVGLCEKAVEFFFETLKPESHRDPDIRSEMDGAVSRTLALFEQEIGDRETLLPSNLTQADLDMGTALAYLSFRYSKDWMTQFPSSARYFQSLSRRKSFLATRPESVE